MRTLYQIENAAFSDRAHIAAQQVIYPQVLGVPGDKLSFESTLLHTSPRNDVLDGELGVDRLIKVSVPSLPAPLQLTVQERFRRPEYVKFRDLTITEFNYASGCPSELFKISTGLFVYGYFDESAQIFKDVIVLDVARLLLALAQGSLPYIRRYNKKQQSFLCIKYEDLISQGIALSHIPEARCNSYAA